jgi:RNA polymerase sigma-70 factor, ECF subfamily
VSLVQMNRDRTLFWKQIEPEHQKAAAYCRKLMGNRDDGDDLYQDALVRALTSFASLRNIETFRHWFYRIIINCFKNRKRQKWWKRFIPISTEIEELPGRGDPAALFASQRRLEIAFKALTPADRALVNLHELEGWKISELSQLQGKSEGNIKVRLCRARKKMRDAIIRYFENSPAVVSGKSFRSEDEICVVTKPGKD